MASMFTDMTTTPNIGETVTAITLGTTNMRVRIEVTHVEPAEDGWRVWGYRVERSSFTKRRPRQTAYPNEYFVPDRAAQ